MLSLTLLAVLSAAAEPSPTSTVTAEMYAVQAADAVRRGDVVAARKAVDQALSIDPDQPEARRIRASLDAGALDGERFNTAVRQAARDADLTTACENASFLIAAGRSREAIGLLEPALAQTDPSHPLRDKAVALIVQARSAEVREELATASNGRVSAADNARSLAATGEITRSSLRSERLARIRDLRLRGHLELALAHLRALLRDLPDDAEVEALFRKTLDEAHSARSASIAERERELRAEVTALVERSLIPEGFDGQPIFPRDWHERRSGRQGILEAATEIPPWQQALLDRLASRVSISFDDTPFTEAASAITQLGGVNVVVSPELLASDRRITLRAAGMRVEDILMWISEQAGTQWHMADGAIFLGDGLRSPATVALHDIGELLVGTGDFPGMRLDLTTTGQSGSPASFSDAGPSETPSLTADDIADLIKRSVSPDAWKRDDCSIGVRNGALLVSAPIEVHELIREFLRAQSAQRNLSVHVEARWLELQDRFVEEIGVSWTSGPETLIELGRGQNSGLQRQSDSWAVNGRSVNRLPSTSMSIQPATINSGLTLQTAMLQNSQYSAVLHAIERNAQGRILEAPELACLNGQQANAFFGSQAAYISDYQIVGGYYDPVISVINTGAALEVRPIISSDRKYVTLELRTALSNATLFTEFIVAVIPNLSAGIDTDGDGLADVYLPQSAVYPLELPNVSIRTTETTVMLPDRGSILVGGFNASLDQFTASRVPLLGSVPFLGRIFGARGRYADKSQLYLLSTATIINYPELEARL